MAKEKTKTREQANIDFDFSSIDDEVDKASKIQAIEVKERLDTNIAIHSGSLALDVAILGGGYYPGRAYDWVGPESGGKCLVGTCSIPTENGIFKIKDLVGEDVDGFVERDIPVYTRYGIEHTSHVFCKESPLVQIIQDNGISLTGTPEHPVLILNPDLTFSFKQLRDLNEGEYVVNILGRKQFSVKDVDITFTSKTFTSTGEIFNWVGSANTDLAYLLGILVSRGGYFTDNSFIYTGDKKRLDMVEKAIRNVFNIEVIRDTVQENKSNKTCIKITDTAIIEFLEYIGLRRTSNENWSVKGKQVPWVIFQSTEPIICAFLCGYLMCDATINEEIEIYNNSPKLSKEIQTLLLELGIFTYYTRKHNTNKKIEYIRMYIPHEYKNLVYETLQLPKVYSRVTFKSCEKTNVPYIGRALNLKNSFMTRTEFNDFCLRYKDGEFFNTKVNLQEIVSNSDFYYGKIVKKRNFDTMHKVYDLTIPTSHEFIANNTVVHNTTHGNMALSQALAFVPHYSVGAYFDYEGSLDKTWFLNIADMPDEKPENIFGLRDEDSGNWIIKPRVRMYKPAFGEQGLLLIIKQLNSKPDKSLIMDEWWYTWTPVDAKVKKKTGGLLAKDIEAMLKSLGIEHDKKFLKQTGLYGVKVPNNYGGCEGIYFIDSYASMTPRQTAEDDSAAMAQQGRMFGKYINQIKSLISAKGYTVIGINQIRKNPNAGYGDPEYQPGGEALKHFCDLRNRIGSVSNPNGGGPIEKENNGRDEYKHYIIRNKKNKITTPYGEIKGRYWTKRDGKTGCGVDPVLDTINYLNLTGQLETGRKGYNIVLKDNSKAAQHLSDLRFKYEEIKDFIVNKEVDTGKKTAKFDIRKHCLKQIKKGVAMKLYYANQGSDAEQEEDTDDTE